MNILYEEVSPGSVSFSKEFVGFEKFENGCYVNLFDGKYKSISKMRVDLLRDVCVGADGINSKVRGCIFPDVSLNDSTVREMSLIAHHENLNALVGSDFIEMHHPLGGLTFGIAPLSKNIAVMYIIYSKKNRKKIECMKGKSYLKSIIREITNDKLFCHVLDLCDLNNSYRWLYRDAELLPDFHKGRVVLIGDAAHPMLPFSTQGVSSAVEDAVTLSDCIVTHGNLEGNIDEILNSYNKARNASMQSKIDGSRWLMKQFMMEKNDFSLVRPSIIL